MNRAEFNNTVCESPAVVTLWAGAVRQAKLSHRIWPCHRLWGFFYVNVRRKGGDNMDQSIKNTVINSLAYIRELCEGATPENWANMTLAAMTVVDSTIDVVKDNL